MLIIPPIAGKVYCTGVGGQLRGETMEVDNDRARRWWAEVPPLLTVEDIAWLFKVHKNTVYNWIRSEKLRAFKVGRDWRIRKEDLQCLGGRDA